MIAIKFKNTYIFRYKRNYGQDINLRYKNTVRLALNHISNSIFCAKEKKLKRLIFKFLINS